MAGKDQNIEQTHAENLETILVVPASKLDADQYSADDLDGVTESVFGSGNVAYASLQASQTDEALRNSESLNTPDSDISDVVGATKGALSSPTKNDNSEFYFESVDASTNTDRPFEEPSGANAAENNDVGNFTSSTVGSVSASQLSSDNEAFSYTNTGSAAKESNIESAFDGEDGKDGTDGEDPKDPDLQDPNTTDPEITLDLGINALDIEFVDVVDEIRLDELEDLIGDVDLDLGFNLGLLKPDGTNNENGDSDITLTPDIDFIDADILSSDVEIELDELEALIGDVDLDAGVALNVLGQHADPVVNNQIGGTGEDTPLKGIQETLQDIASNALEGLNITGSDDASASDSDVIVDIAPEILNIDMVDVETEIILDPVEDLTGDLDVDIDLGTNLLDPGNEDNSADDSDVTITPDIDFVDADILDGDIDIDLNPVEELAGDVDLDAGIAVDILGESADPVVNDAEGGTGEDTILDELGDTLENVAEAIIPGLSDDNPDDSDLSLDIEVDALDTNIIDVDLEVSLDPVEDLTTDIDLDVGAALDLLSANSYPEEAEGDTEQEESWTEDTIGEGGLFDDMVDGLAGAADCLPDPCATVGEGLGVLDVEPELDVGSLGGLFG